MTSLFQANQMDHVARGKEKFHGTRGRSGVLDVEVDINLIQSGRSRLKKLGGMFSFESSCQMGWTVGLSRRT